MNKINHISEFESRNSYSLQVYYNNGKVFRYTKKDNLPNTVLNFYLNGKAETKYTETGRVTYIR